MNIGWADQSRRQTKWLGLVCNLHLVGPLMGPVNGNQWLKNFELKGEELHGGASLLKIRATQDECLSGVLFISNFYSNRSRFHSKIGQYLIKNVINSHAYSLVTLLTKWSISRWDQHLQVLKSGNMPCTRRPLFWLFQFWKVGSTVKFNSGFLYTSEKLTGSGLNS